MSPRAKPGVATASDPGTGAASAYLVRGDDASLVAQAARSLIEQLVGVRDPALVVEEHGGSSIDDLNVGAVVDACTTPPFLVDRRVVVVRDAGRLSAMDGARLADTLADPLPSTVLVLVAGGGTVPQALSKAVAARGEVVDTTVGASRRDRQRWLGDHLKGAPVHLTSGAAHRLGDHLGDDLGRLSGILQTLAAAYGESATVDVEELEPFLGEAGSVRPWDLTDNIDRGTTAEALFALHRLLGPGGRAGPEVMGTLHRHFSNMLRLDGAAVMSEEDAASLLGVSQYPAKKALDQARRLGSERLAQAIGLLADADLDIRGQSALQVDVVLEVLVARLCRLVRARQPSGRR
jgi:DNA polymerase III subunit delta